MHRRLLTALFALSLVRPAFAQTPTPQPIMPVSTPAPPPAAWPYHGADAQHPLAHGRHGAVASVSTIADRVGIETLRAGGNAVDAAIAVAFALAVVYPQAGNLGGGGYMVIRQANGESAALDYRETAPGKASHDMYLDAVGNLTKKSLVGALAAGVPGTVAGMEAAHKRFGRLPWAKLVAPAIKLADQGFVVDADLAASLAHSHDLLIRFPASRAAYMPNAVLPKAGSVFRQPDLARTLRRVQQEGARGFYQGPIAGMIADDMARNGGLITRQDLASYRPVWRAPLQLTYRGYHILTMPPSSSGGVTLAEMLNILEGYDFHRIGWHSAAHVHLMIEAERRAFADRNAYLGDPAFVKDMPIATLISKAYAARRRASIRPDEATPRYGLFPGLSPKLEESPAPTARHESEQTTHFSVVDRWGNAVSNTYTLNNLYGAGIVMKGTGVLMNDEMDDFAAKPGSPNLFGLVQGENNAIAPGKRMLSSMTPSIVLDPTNQLYLVIGSPGGSTIPTTVLQVITNMIDFGLPLDRAIAAPRVHHQDLPDVLYMEPNGLDQATLTALVRMKHQVEVRSVLGDAMGVSRLPDGSLEGFSDPRHGGQALWD